MRFKKRIRALNVPEMISVFGKLCETTNLVNRSSFSPAEVYYENVLRLAA